MARDPYISPPFVVVEKLLRRRKVRGEWITPLGWATYGEGGRKPLIEIDPRQSDKSYLETLLHEAIHIDCPWMDELAVVDLGERLAEIAWRRGYRKVRLL